MLKSRRKARLIVLLLVFTLVFSSMMPVLTEHSYAEDSVETIIINNNGASAADPGYSDHGGWQASIFKGYNDTNTRYVQTQGSYATWVPSLGTSSFTPGNYKVSMYKMQRGSLSDPSVQVEVKYAENGSEIHTIEYSSTGPEQRGWVELGTYAFSGSEQEFVRMTRTTASGGTYTHADAMKFERVGGSEEPEEPELERYRIDKDSHPYSGAWSSNTNYSFFSFIGSGWWNDGWSWMYNNVSNENASVNFQFTGTEVALFMIKHDSGGIAKVYLDGELLETIDTYNAAQTTEKVLEVSDLPLGQHTLRVETAGKSSSVAGDGYIRIAAFEYVGEAFVSEPAPEMTMINRSNSPSSGRWADNNIYPYLSFDGAGWWSDNWGWIYNNVNNANQFVNFHFTGTAIALYMTKYPGGGIVDIYLDGAKVASADSYSPETIASEKVFEMYNLDMGEHTLRVGTAGKNELATGNSDVRIVAFEYGTAGEWSNPGIKVTSLTKTEYAMGEAFDLSTLVVTHYDGENDPAPAPITLDMISGFNSSTVGVKTLTVSYGGFTANFTIRVVVPPFEQGIINLGRQHADEITASSTKTGYDARNVINNIVEGYENAQSAEWSSNQTAGAWIEQSFKYPVTVTEIRLFDVNDFANATFTGTLTFSDGSSEPVVMPALTPLLKTPAIVKLNTPKTDIEWVRFTANTHHASATALGLAEFQVLGPDVDLLFKPEADQINVKAGIDATLTILRNEEAQALAGTYDMDLPEGWSVVSGGSFAAGSAADQIVFSVPETYFIPSSEIVIRALSSTEEQYGYTMTIEAKLTGYTIIDKVITVYSPEYYSEVSDDEIEVIFHAPGYTHAKAYSLHAPDAANTSPYGYMKAVAENITLSNDGFGKGTFQFNASDYPYGPIAIHITAWNSNDESDDSYLQLFNYAGQVWDGGPANTIDTLPAALDTHGLTMDLVFYDEFTEMPTITRTGAGEDVKYAAAKPDPTGWPEYANAKFTPPNYSYGDVVSNYSPFAIVDEEYMKLETKYWGEVIEPNWGQTFTTGFLSSSGTDRSGFITKPGSAHYFETRLFLPPNPGLWPAFWTLTHDAADGRPGRDELDILEAYMGGNPDRITFNHHTWGDGYGGIHTGGTANTADFGSGVNLAQGWHTYGMLVTEQMTYYYFDDIYIEGSAHATLDRSWTVGSYFMINNAYRQGDADKFPGGFQRYGNTAQMYVDWVRVFQVENGDFTPMYSNVEVTPGEEVTITVLRGDAAKNLSGTYDIELPSGWTVVSGGTFTAGSTQDTIVLNVSQAFDQFQGRFSITPVIGDIEYTAFDIHFMTMGLYETEIYPSLNETGDGYEVNFTFHNHSSSLFEDIVITVSGPEGWTEVQTITVNPEASKTITFAIANLALYAKALYSFDMQLTEDYGVRIERSFSGLAAARAEGPMTIDGTIDADEWAGAMEIVLDQQSQTSGTWNGPADLSATGKVKWDDDYLYLAVEVTDNAHVMTAGSIVDAWSGDSLQISFDPARADGIVIAGPHLSFTAALNSETGAYGVAVDRSNYPELGLGWGQLLTESQSVVKRDEASKTTTYTIAFAWSEILPPAFSDIASLGMAFVVNDGDGTGRKGWITYMSGIATGKDPALFGDLILSPLTNLDVQSVSDNAALNGITVDGIALSDFQPENTAYLLELPAGTAQVPVVTAEPSDPLATLMIEQAALLPGEAIITVTAQDGITQMTYTVSFTVEPSNLITVSTINEMINHYEQSGDLRGALLIQTRNALKQAQHHLDKGSMKQAGKFIQNFQKHLNNKGLGNLVSTEAKVVLLQMADELLQQWNE